MDGRPVVLVSLCLLGAPCRYDGRGNRCDRLEDLMARAQLVPVCPEQLGGLPTPRVPAERVGDRVLTREGGDVTEAFRRGAAEAARLAERFGAKYALLKSRSPSCGPRGIYDGSFSGVLTGGQGVTAQALAARGVALFGEEEVDRLIDRLECDNDDPL